MIRNYIKIAFRNLWRHKSFSLINIVGLAVGLSAFLLIVIYVSFELSYDKFHAKTDQVYRLNANINSANDVMKMSSSSAPMGPALKADFPEVLDYTRIFTTGGLVKVNNQMFEENRIYFVDPSFFNVFSFPLISGDEKTALKSPKTAVLTESTARKYFGSANPVGKTLTAFGTELVTVTGVVKDVPANTQFKFDILYSVSSLEKPGNSGVLHDWSEFDNFTFLLLAKDADPLKLQARLPAFLNSHISEASRKNGQNYALYLMPLKDTYMDPRGGIEQGSISNVYIFSIVALFILLIAAINFINLTTARATERAKEVGVRKVIGAARSQLTIQFLGESIIICLVSFIVAAMLVTWLLPMFNQLAGKELSNSLFENGNVLILFVISLLIGLAAGAYPALALSAFKPVVVLKGKFSSSSKGTLLRKGLVVFQFTISIVLIVGTLVVYNQLTYMRNQPLGFDKEQMVNIAFGGDGNVLKSYQSIKNEFKSIPNVQSITMSAGIPGAGNGNAHSEIENRQGTMQPVNINMYNVDYDYIKTFGMKVIAGRAFSTDFPTDSTKSIVINEAAVKLLGYRSPNEAIGKKFSQWGREGQIVGVIKNFHYRSLQSDVLPLNMRINPSAGGSFTLKISGKNVPATLKAVEDKWKVLIPQRPFSYFFVDQNFNKQYASEERFGKLFMYFAVLAIFISCLGLLGLASYSTIQRTKEIGIRKVLGASIPGIVNMLSRDFLLLVLIAALIAFPVSWYGMNNWLKEFAYRQSIGWMVFAVAGMLAFMIAILTVSFHAIKASLANPVKSLRSE